MAVDFTTWTETDPNGEISVSSSSVQSNMGGLVCDTDAWVAKNHVTGPIGNAFEIDVQIECPQENTTPVGIWGVVNALDDIYEWEQGTTGSTGIWMQFDPSGGAPQLALYDEAWNGDGIGPLSEATPYYCTITRYSSGTALDVDVYSDSGRTNLVGTATIATTARSYDYHQVCMSYNSGDGFSYSNAVKIENLVWIAGDPMPPMAVPLAFFMPQFTRPKGVFQ